MHPFIHPLSTAVDPAWQSRSDWEIYKGFAKKFSEVCVGHLGVEREIVLTPLMHDSPAELAQPLDVKEWKRGEVDLVPGKTAPQIAVVERDYPNVHRRFTALGPLMSSYLNNLAFVVYPYVCLAVFLMGSLARFDRDQYTWKSDSSQMLRAGTLRWGSNLFHAGIDRKSVV